MDWQPPSVGRNPVFHCAEGKRSWRYKYVGYRHALGHT